jgi:pre-mRNA-processing factor 40
LTKFKALLANLNLTPSCTLKEANEIFREKFDQDLELKQMDPMDVLICFEDYIMTLDSQYRQSRNADRKAIFRKERHCRENFYKLLVDLQDSGNLHMKSKWKEIYPLVRDDKRYLDMLECLGSSPLDFFRDMLMEMEDAYLSSRRIVMDVTRV